MKNEKKPRQTRPRVSSTPLKVRSYFRDSKPKSLVLKFTIIDNDVGIGHASLQIQYKQKSALPESMGFPLAHPQTTALFPYQKPYTGDETRGIQRLLADASRWPC